MLIGIFYSSNLTQLATLATLVEHFSLIRYYQKDATDHNMIWIQIYAREGPEDRVSHNPFMLLLRTLPNSVPCILQNSYALTRWASKILS